MALCYNHSLPRPVGDVIDNQAIKEGMHHCPQANSYLSSGRSARSSRETAHNDEHTDLNEWEGKLKRSFTTGLTRALKFLIAIKTPDFTQTITVHNVGERVSIKL